MSVVVPAIPDLLDTTRASVQGLAPLLIALEPLTRYTPNGELEPNLAERADQPDPLTYVYRLRPGVTFWDGSPLTVDDILYSFGLHTAKGTSSFIAQQWSVVRSARRTGANEITIRLRKPNPQFGYTVAQTGIVSAAFHRKNAKRAGSPRVLNMGTGPYRFEAFEPYARVVFARNDEYWGAPARIAQLELRMIADDSTRLLAVQSNDMDGVIGIPLGQVKSFSAVRGLQLTDTVDYGVYKLNFDLTKKPWDDPALRRALAHAVDRDAITSGILGGNAQPATTLTPPSVMETLISRDEVRAAYARIGGALPAHDIERGKAELARSSRPRGVATTVIVTGSDPTLAAIMQTVAQSAKQIGIELKIKQVDDNTYFNAVYFKHTTDGVSIDNFTADSPDPVNIPASALSSANAYPGGSGVNIANYRSATVDGLLARQGRRSATDPKRAALIVDALEQSARDLPYVPIAYPKVIVGMKDGRRMDGLTPFWWMSRWPEQIVTAA